MSGQRHQSHEARSGIRRIAVCALAIILGGAMAMGQTQPLSQYSPPPAYASVLTAPQLDQMLAPIALYPDPLIAQLLMASTYPLEVVQAARWVQDPANAALKGDQLAAALGAQSWDPSVKSLVPFPQILQTMNDKLDWTQNLGNAFLAQQADVMASVQRLRRQAQAAGHLASSAQQVVSTDAQVIQVEPSNPQIIYVPSYDPAIVYGGWAYPDYPPYFFPVWPGYVLADGFAFGFGFAILPRFWGWGRPDWGGGYIRIDGGRFHGSGGGQAGLRGGAWQHDPAHRQGVAYRNDAVRSQFDAARMSARRPSVDVRGYDHAAPAAMGQATRGAAVERPVAAPRPAAAAAAPRPAAAAAPRSAFQGVERGSAARSDAQRGYSSRQASSGGQGRSSGGGRRR